ncbi:sensor histidine kinase [Haloechinothrix sp. LS1_15]|uniref:sensor histidine kinase n=1 Tax=Haloechinothrix sp. LS1_15 TaxID=2652248 RepID=UPI002945C71A|nr:sensor histidine kinase [Haloechinothrix sp. LS1_15]MDV6011150.1 sensor histidine kinase [Haloechinothrix sp. LS1_15]
MSDRRGEYWALGSMLAVWVLIGTPMLLTAGDLVAGPVWLWWACYLGYLAGYASIILTMEQRPGTARLGLAVVVVCGAGVVLLAPRSVWTQILLVFTTAVAAYLLSRRAVIALLLANTALVALVVYLIGAPAMEVIVSAFIYAALQSCTVWAVWLQLRESEARERLSVVNTELRAATALLAESSRASERTRIARDLHDALGHQLTALNLELEVAAHRSQPPASEHVERARGLAKDLLAEVRAAVGELRAHSPRLRDALREMVADLPHPRVHLDVDDSLELSAEQSSALIRCAQEVITNTIRHSDADNLWITVGSGESGKVALTARDDGRGTPLLRLGNGLTGLRERVEQLGGAVTFESRAGFRVNAEVPVP